MNRERLAAALVILPMVAIISAIAWFGWLSERVLGAEDIVVFDLARLRDRATYDDPHQYCEGMVYVLVNGELAIDREEFTDVMSGVVLHRRGI